MHTIQFKNKRSKAILTLQWETPDDLLAWAESVKDSKGMEFNMVDPAIPIILKSDKPAPKKLKTIKLETVEKSKSHKDISILMDSVLSDLQEEFELQLCKDFVNENILDAKKHQMDILNQIKDSLDLLHELQEKTELCLINYGVSKNEYVRFLNRSLEEIIIEATKNKAENSVQIPYIFMHIKERAKYGTSETKIATKPILGLEKIMELAKNKKCKGI